MDDHLARRIQFMNSLRQIAQGDQESSQVDNLVFTRLTNVENQYLIAAIKDGFELFVRDLIFFWARRICFNAAELFVVKQLMYRWMIAADWTLRIFPELELTEP